LKVVKKRFSKPGRVNSLFIVNDQFILVRTIGKTTYLNRIPIKESEGASSQFETPLNGYLACKETEFVYSNKNFEFSNFYFTWNNNNFALFNGKFLVAGLDFTNSVKIFDLKGKLIQSLDFHTMTVLCTSCTSEILASGGLDSRIKLWKYEKDLFFEGLTLNGHNSPIFSLKMLESYQLIFSASDQNLLLVHDLKTGLCLQKLDLKVKDLDVNEIGLLAVATEDHLKVLGVNFDQVSEKKIFDVVKSIKLSPCGNFCIQAYEHSIFIHDIFDESKDKLFSECSGFDIQFNPSDKNIFIVYDQGTDLHIDLLRFVSTQMILNQKKIIEELV
jgi:WD40 repeat protein